MKKGFLLFVCIITLIFVSFFTLFAVNKSAYIPKHIKNVFLYTQAKILSENSKELAKYFLYEAKSQGKQCIDKVKFKYENAQILIQYLYPLRECINFSFTDTNKDANLSKDNIIISNISVLLNEGSGVNEEIFINENIFLYPDDNF